MNIRTSILYEDILRSIKIICEEEYKYKNK